MNFLNGFGGSAFPILAVVVGIIIVVLLVRALRAGGEVRASQDWVSTNGHVQTSGVQSRRSRQGRSGYGTSYYPAVVYEYVVNGQRYQSSRIRFGMEVGYGWAQPAQNLVSKYPAGGVVQVYYNPANPTESVLERTASPTNRILIVVMIIILIMVIGTTALTLGAFNLIPQFLRGMMPR